MAFIEVKTALQTKDFLSGKHAADEGAFMAGDGRLGKPVNFAVRNNDGVFYPVSQRAKSAAKDNGQTGMPPAKAGTDLTGG